MRVALFFLAFSFLFAFLVPQLLTIFYKTDDQVAWQLMQGADPTAILEETASGAPPLSDKCGSVGYSYYQTANGYRYIGNQNSLYISVLIDNRPKLFIVSDENKEAVPVENTVDNTDTLAELELILADCVHSSNTPLPSQLIIHSQR